MKQLPLSAPHPLPSRPFARYSRKTDEVRVCARCGREIIARRRTMGSEAIEEFVSERGEFLQCDGTYI